MWFTNAVGSMSTNNNLTFKKWREENAMFLRNEIHWGERRRPNLEVVHSTKLKRSESPEIV